MPQINILEGSSSNNGNSASQHEHSMPCSAPNSNGHHGFTGDYSAIFRLYSALAFCNRYAQMPNAGVEASAFTRSASLRLFGFLFSLRQLCNSSMSSTMKMFASLLSFFAFYQVNGLSFKLHAAQQQLTNQAYWSRLLAAATYLGKGSANVFSGIPVFGSTNRFFTGAENDTATCRQDDLRAAMSAAVHSVPRSLSPTDGLNLLAQLTPDQRQAWLRWYSDIFNSPAVIAVMENDQLVEREGQVLQDGEGIVADNQYPIYNNQGGFFHVDQTRDDNENPNAPVDESNADYLLPEIT